MPSNAAGGAPKKRKRKPKGLTLDKVVALLTEAGTLASHCENMGIFTPGSAAACRVRLLARECLTAIRSLSELVGAPTND